MAEKSNRFKKGGVHDAPAKKKDIAGIFLLSFSIILMLAFILSGDRKYVGAIGSVLSGSLKDFLGYICYLIPVILFWWAVAEFRHKKFPFKYSMGSGLVILILGGSILLHVIWEGAGGMLGDFSSDVIIQITFGRLGAYIIAIALILISVILMADISIKKLVMSLINLTEKSVPQVSKTEKKKKVKKEKHDRLKKKKEQKIKDKEARPGVKKPDAKPAGDIQTSAGYELPLSLLDEQPEAELSKKEEQERGEKIKVVLRNFDISSEISGICIGPSITRYEVTVPADIKLSRIRNLESNIAMALEAKTVRLLTPIPGKAAVGVEVPAIHQETVYIRTLLQSKKFKSTTTKLPYCLGKSVNGDLEIADLSQMPHLLLAGATNSGKSIAIHVLINSIIFKSSPEDVRILLIDPKKVELPRYNGIPHLISEVVTDPGKAVKMLQAITKEMDVRYNILSENNVADISGYNDKAKKEGLKKLPRLVIIIDELHDLMLLARDKVETTVVRIAQMARAVGIHLVLATQRPSVDVITGIIKANLPARIAFHANSGVDSRTILDANGAEKLLGSGDMLYMSSELPHPERLQGTFISREKEVEKVVKYLKEMELEYDSGFNLEDRIKETKSGIDFEDDIYPQAVELVIRMKKASVSLLQRRLRIGYNRAARLIDKMEDNGIISEDKGVKGRDILVSEGYLEKLN